MDAFASNVKGWVGWSPQLREEMRAVMKLAWPIQATNLADFGLSIVTLLVVGRLGSLELGAAALGNLYVNFIGMAPLVGMCGAIDTLSSQACGAGSYARVGQITQRAVVILSLLMIPIGAAWLCAPLLFSQLGQEPEPAVLAGQYAQWMLIGLAPLTWYECLKRHLQAVGLVSPPMYTTLCAIAVNVLLSAGLVHGTSLGFIGAPIAMGLCRWVQFLALAWYHIDHRRIHGFAQAMQRAVGWRTGEGSVNVDSPAGNSGESEATVPEALTTIDVRGDATSVDMTPIGEDGPAESVSPQTKEREEGKTGVPMAATDGNAIAAPQPDIAASAAVSLERHDLLDATWSAGLDVTAALSQWGQFLSLGLPSSCLLLTEWGSFEAQALLGGWYSARVLAAHTVLATTSSASFMFILGFSIASGIRVGQRAGENAPAAAALAYRATLLLGAIFAAINALFVLAASPFWGEVFTDDPDVVGLVRTWLPLLAVFTLPDTIQGITCGALRGLGFPGLAAASNVLSYMVVGLPVAFLLCQRAPYGAGLGLPGLWAGSTLGFTVSAVGTVAAARWIDWSKAAATAHARATSNPSGSGAAAS